MTDRHIFNHLFMGLSISPAEMQHSARPTVNVVEGAFPGTKGIAYLNDLVVTVVPRHQYHLNEVTDYFVRIGIHINVGKSASIPAS